MMWAWARRRVAVAALLTALPMGASALGLGELASQSFLGEALRLVIPVILGPEEEARAECFRVVPQTSSPDALPQLSSARLAIEGGASGPRLVVSTARGVTEPVLRVVLQVGCEPGGLQREFLLLLDPPIKISSAVVPSESPTASALAPATTKTTPPQNSPSAPRHPALVTEDAPPSRRGAALGSSPGRSQSVAATPQATATPASALAREIQPIARSDRLRLSVGAAASGAPMAARLVLSSTLTPPAEGQATLSADALALLRAKQARLKTAPEDQDLSLSVEAELVVLDKRLKDLQATLDAAQARLRGMESKEAGDAAALAKARLAAESHVDYSDWFAMIALAAALTAIAILLAQRRRRAADADNLWDSGAGGLEAPRNAIDAAEATLAPQTVLPASLAKPAEPSPAKGGLAYYHLGDTSHHLSVSELAQITEEARVFVTLGHPDKAILALRDHLDTHADTAPAPWLMLLELYRRTNNRGEYERSAAEFRHRYNAFIPPWEDPNAGQEGPGLEAYPHLVKQICDLWRSPTCKVFLDELLYDNRGGNRIGFNLGAYQDIMLLRSLLETPIAEPKPAPQGLDAHKAAPPLAPLADLEFELDQDLLPTTSNRCMLEIDHPGILERLTLNWGTPHVIHFLESLLFADHTAKSSFGEAALSELMFLHDIAVDLADLRQGDQWDQDPSMGRKSAR